MAQEHELLSFLEDFLITSINDKFTCYRNNDFIFLNILMYCSILRSTQVMPDIKATKHIKHLAVF